MTLNLVDSNVWLAVVLSGHVHHASARTWLEAVEGTESVLFCRATQQAFLRLLTNPAVLAPYGNPPLTNREVWRAYQSLLSDDRIAFRASEPTGLEARWKQFAVRDSSSPKLWMDAYLAAFAVASGCRMVTTDGAFRQFAGIDVLLLGAG